MGLNVPAASTQQGVIWGNPYLVSKKDLKVKTAADVRSRRVVMYDTDAKQIKVATVGLTNGIRGICGEKVQGGKLLTKAADGTTADDFAADDIVKVLGGVGAGLIGVLAVSQTIIAGDLLVCAVKGRLQKAAALAITVPSGSTAVTSTAAQPNLTEAGTLPPSGSGGGIVVARAEEDVTTDGSTNSPICLTWLAG